MKKITYNIYLLSLVIITILIINNNIQIISCKNPYKILGASRLDSMKTIRRKYKQLMKISHPDKLKTNNEKEKEEAKKKFIEIQEAYERIKGSDYSEEDLHSDDDKNEFEVLFDKLYQELEIFLAGVGIAGAILYLTKLYRYFYNLVYYQVIYFCFFYQIMKIISFHKYEKIEEFNGNCGLYYIILFFVFKILRYILSFIFGSNKTVEDKDNKKKNNNNV